LFLLHASECIFKWSEPKDVVKKEDLFGGWRPMNPCPVYDEPKNTLYLFFICIEGNISENYQIRTGCNKTRLCYMTTQDCGQTWSDVTELTDKLPLIKNSSTFAVGPGHGLQTKAGTMIIPAYVYPRCGTKGCRHAQAFSIYYDSLHEKWETGAMLESESLECEMAEFYADTDSFIYCNARSRVDKRVEAVSKDGKEMIFRSHTSTLDETSKGCQGSVVSFPAQPERADSNNEWLLYSHPTNQSKRVDLGVYLNESPKDSGAWSKPWIINNGPSGYSDLAYLGEGWFACLMERGVSSEEIALMVFSYNDVKQNIGK